MAALAYVLHFSRCLNPYTGVAVSVFQSLGTMHPIPRNWGHRIGSIDIGSSVVRLTDLSAKAACDSLTSPRKWPLHGVVCDPVSSANDVIHPMPHLSRAWERGTAVQSPCAWYSLRSQIAREKKHRLLELAQGHRPMGCLLTPCLVCGEKSCEIAIW